MKRSDSETWLCKSQPLMKVPNRTEFYLRLQWLSEGMLHVHLQNWDHPDVRAKEVQDYQVFCILRDYEKGRGLLAAATQNRGN